MNATAPALALVDRLMASDNPANIARLQAQAWLIAAYEEANGRGSFHAPPMWSNTSWISTALPELMMAAYPKSERDDLSTEQRRRILAALESIKK
jgi:hypothetical protein